MILNQETIQKILGIEGEVALAPKEMAKTVKVTFFPYVDPKISSEVKKFSKELKEAFIKLGVTVIPYEKALTTFPKSKMFKWYLFASWNTFMLFLKKVIGIKDTKYRPDLRVMAKVRKGKRVRKGISIIALGEGKDGNLPMDYTMSFRKSSVVTILDMPPGINNKTDFLKHFDTAMNLFAHHMTNIVIGVDKENWLLYNFNAAHPIYTRDEKLETHILHTLIPKLAAPVQPPRLSEFIIRQETFNPRDKFYRPFMEDFVKGSSLFNRTGLYPPGKSVDELPFRNDFYRWVGKIHLDNRTGMSYGFMARQLPVKLPSLIPFEEAMFKFNNFITKEKGYFIVDEHIFLILQLPSGRFCMEVPDVWVLTQRSGSDKTHFNPDKDLVKMGLSHGKMILETPKGLKLQEGYRPSFDTKVILAHAIGNAIVGAILLHLFPNHPFPKKLQKSGMALSHWHGYLKRDFIPRGWHVHGAHKPHVACSTPQSAIYALEGKMRVLMESLHSKDVYLGDIHIEPHHGTNMNFPSLEQLASFLTQNPDSTKLGNHYLYSYQT